MRRPPPLRMIRNYPVTGGLALLAVTATLLWWSGRSIDRFEMNVLAFGPEPWRLVTAIFPHVDPLHLLFNVYWLWVFGTVIEQSFGHLRTLGIIALFAVGSSAVEFAFRSGGVGLSGVGYGLFGMLWVLARHDTRFYLVVDANTVKLFIGWFLLCIVLTAAGTWNVGNFAHGAGAVFGVLFGFAVANRSRHPRACAVGLVATLALTAALATAGRPYVNLAPRKAGRDIALLAYQAYDAGNAGRAVSLYEQAIGYDRREPDWWYNLGIAYGRLGRAAEADKAFKMAARLGWQGNREERDE